MVYGVISDTHGSFAAWGRALEGPFSDVDRILHAGDVFYHGTRNPWPEEYDTQRLADSINGCATPISIARGNCDSEVDQMVCNIPIVSPFLVLDEPEGRIMVQHWQRGGEGELDELLERFGPRVFITGHTHVPEIRKSGKALILNPGSPSLTKRQDGKRTVARLEMEETVVRVCIVDVDKNQTLERIET